MRFIILLVVLFFSALARAATEVTVPVTITAPSFMTPDFPVPDNKTGSFKVQIPCDPKWSLEVGLQFSIDNGKTWSCDMSTIKCAGFTRNAVPCVNMRGEPISTFGAVWKTTKGALDSKTKMRIQFISNMTKTVNVTVTFDPQ